MPLLPFSRISQTLAICAAALLLHFLPQAQAQIPAFPGAEGAGARALGGRGGDVYHVTNTNPSGAGSLAYGLTTGVPSAGRTIVFDVSGYAHISKELRITAGKITIAGQTAPGDGFGLKDGTLRVSGDDIVIRHLRLRNGNSADAIDLDSGSLNSIFDHCDAMLSNDENMSSFGSPPENMSWQWGVNAWGMESHSAGGLWDQNHATSHHSLWAHNHTRNPKARPTLLDWVNNVTFDWDIGFILGDSETPANWNTNVVGNYFIAGTSGKTKALEKGARDRNGNWNFHVFLNNNRFDGNRNGIVDGTDTGYGMLSGDVEHLASALVNTGIPVTADDPLLAYKKVASAAGPLRLDVDPAKPLRDELATILANELVAQTHHHVSSPAGIGASNGGFGVLASTAAPVDTDKDGMPDFYEDALLWNKTVDDHNTAVPATGATPTNASFFPVNTPAGYTRLEEYLHFLAIPHGFVAKSVNGGLTSIVIDLRKFTSGFTVTPTFATANVIGGTVAPSGPGNAIATFSPTVGYTGRARFEFTVSDSQGSVWTQTCALVVTNSGLPRDLVWKGDNSANPWDATTTDWLRNGSPTAFGSGDRVAFDSTGSLSPAVNLVGSLSPTTVVVDSPGGYTFGIAGGTGSVVSTGTLTKRGTGTLTMASAQNYTGGGSFEAGTVAIASGGNLSGGALTMLDGTTFTNAYPTGTSGSAAIAFDVPAGNGVTFNSGNRFALTGAVTGAGTINYNIQTTVSRADLGGTMAAFTGSLKFTSSGSPGGGVRLLFNGGAFNGFDGASVDVGGSVSLQPQTNSGGNTFNIGALSGSSTNASLGGGTAGTVNYFIGAAGTDTSFAGSIDGNATLTKSGGGTLTLGGANSLTGATAVNAGALIVNGSLGTGPVSVASGAALGGGGSFGGSTTLVSGATIAPGATGVRGVATMLGGYSATGITYRLDWSNSPGGTNDKIYVTGGSSFVAGANTVLLNLTDGALGLGVYKIVECATGIAFGAQSGVAFNITNLPAGTRQTFAISRSSSGTGGGDARLTVGGAAPANLTWVGALNSATWDLSNTANFNGAAGGTFYNLDAVTLDDTSANRTVALAGSLAPRTLTVNTASGYTLGGTGSLDGGSLLKSGVGVLTINNSGRNTFAGGTAISGGTVVLGSAQANASGLGTGPVTLDGTSLTMFSLGNGTHSGTLPNELVINTTGTLYAAPRCGFGGRVSGSGVFNYFTPYVRADVTGDWSAFSGRVNVITDADGGDFRITASYGWPGLGAASVDLANRVTFRFDGTLSQGAGTFIEIGELSGGPLSYLLGGPTGGRNFTYTIGAKTPAVNEVIFAGTIAEQNTGTATSYIKTGAGIWTLNGACSWNGGTTVQAGTLRIGGSLASGGANFNVLDGATLDLAGGSVNADDVQVSTTGRLTGKGTINGDLTNKGFVDAHLGGALTITGDVVNEGIMRIAGKTALIANGAFVNNGTLDLLTGASSLPPNLENNGIVIDSSSLSTLSAVKSGTTVTVSALTIGAHNYQLQRATSLALADWADVGALKAGNGAVQTFNDFAATGTQRFYHLVVTP